MATRLVERLVSEVPEQFGGILDVAEQERDRPDRQLDLRHGPILAAVRRRR